MDGIIIQQYGAGASAAIGGSATLVGKSDLTAQQANISATTVYAVPAGSAGTYRLSAYAVLTQAATTSSTMPVIQALWTDNDTSVSQTQGFSPTGLVGNTVGLNTSANGWPDHIVFNAKAGTNIQFATVSYASSGATPMQFAIHVKLEYLGA